MRFSLTLEKNVLKTAARTLALKVKIPLAMHKAATTRSSKPMDSAPACYFVICSLELC